jgi:hypothetical protein
VTFPTPASPATQPPLPDTGAAAVNGFFCAYQGSPYECTECGGVKPGDLPYCCHECAASAAARAERHRREIADQRARADAFGREVDRLRAAGHTYQQIDELLKDVPS